MPVLAGDCVNAVDMWRWGRDETGMEVVRCLECRQFYYINFGHDCPAGTAVPELQGRFSMADSLLQTVTTGVVAAPRRVMLYAPHGFGKSTWAAGADAPIFINLEDGLGDVDCAKFPLAREYSEFRAQVAALYTGDHKYKTLVIDTADWLEALVLAEVCRDSQKDSIKDFGYGDGYVKAAEFFHDKIIPALDMLRRNRHMHIVFTAHCRITRFRDPTMDSYDRYFPKLNKAIGDVLMEWCDEVLFGNYRVMVKKADEAFGQKRAIAVGGGERVVYTVERPGAIAKNRLNLPPELPLEWAAYAEHFKQEAK